MNLYEPLRTILTPSSTDFDFCEGESDPSLNGSTLSAELRMMREVRDSARRAEACFERAGSGRFVEREDDELDDFALLELAIRSRGLLLDPVERDDVDALLGPASLHPTCCSSRLRFPSEISSLLPLSTLAASHSALSSTSTSRAGVRTSSILTLSPKAYLSRIFSAFPSETRRTFFAPRKAVRSATEAA